MKYLKYYNSIMDYLTDTRLYPAVSMIYEKDIVVEKYYVNDTE